MLHPSPVKRLRTGLGTLLAIEALGQTPSAAEAAVESAFAAIATVDRRLHPRSEGSDLARINSAALNAPVHVHASTLDLLRFAFRLNRLTDGVFDPCLPTRPGDLRDVEITSDAIVCHAPVALDFGGFAKGYAVDRAIEALQEAGCTAGLVNAGGDLRVFGPVTDPIFLRGPRGELFQIEIGDAALAVTDTDSAHRPVEHQGYYDRRERARQVTGRAGVIANEACVADALTKCVLLCDPEAAGLALRTFGAKWLEETGIIACVDTPPAGARFRKFRQ